jgi:hypothetical protein
MLSRGSSETNSSDGIHVSSIASSASCCLEIQDEEEWLPSLPPPPLSYCSTKTSDVSNSNSNPRLQSLHVTNSKLPPHPIANTQSSDPVYIEDKFTVSQQVDSIFGVPTFEITSMPIPPDTNHYNNEQEEKQIYYYGNQNQVHRHAQSFGHPEANEMHNYWIQCNAHHDTYKTMSASENENNAHVYNNHSFYQNHRPEENRYYPQYHAYAAMPIRPSTTNYQQQGELNVVLPLRYKDTRLWISEYKRKEEILWNTWFRRLKAFYEKHGHSHVQPHHFPQYLAVWVEHQRKQYEVFLKEGKDSSSLARNRVTKLLSLDFEFPKNKKILFY